ncbi:MAG TPA: GTP-binding protein, partial [Thermodesulforhabdus norvegica]|nr:GTP-binding protein [Thermodesulforhabdus norvegica]
MAIVAIIGRPNVGKSTLFNKLSRSRRAIVDDIPGVTRDRLYAYIEWNNKRFILVDTAGLLLETEDPLESGAQEQVDFAIQEATAIVFLVDAKAGLHPEDKHIASLLRKSGKPVFLA